MRETVRGAKKKGEREKKTKGERKKRAEQKEESQSCTERRR